MKKILPLLLLAVLLVSCEDEDAKTPNEAVSDADTNKKFEFSGWDNNSVLLFDTNDFNWPTVDKAVCLQFTFPDANSVDEAAAALREMDTRNAKEFIDIEVVIGDETHTASFEDFFEWMGFKR